MKDNLSDAWAEALPPGKKVLYITDAIASTQKHTRFGCTAFDELQEMYLD